MAMIEDLQRKLKPLLPRLGLTKLKLPQLGGPPPPPLDDDAHIEASKAPLMEHLIELRQRLIYSIAGFFAMFLFCFFFSKQIYNILAWPYLSHVPADMPVKMIATGLLEQFFTQIKVALFGGAFLSFPWVANQIYKFVAPGLYKNERDAFWPYLVATPVFFLLGAMVVYFLAMPMVVRFAFANMEGTDAQLMLRVQEYLGTMMTLIFGFGICFQLPVILTLLARANIFGSKELREFRNYAYLGIAVLAAVLTPPDPFSMLALMAPTMALYELAIYAVIHIVERPRGARNGAEP
jgi:sec-independent protein translocase protein TatC